MEVDKKFSCLELSFSNIESKILDKRQSIESCYQKNVDEIEEKFSKENLEFQTDALNQSREKMLKQICDDRNGLLETVNSTWETIRDDRVNGQNELNRVSRELKDKYSSLCLNKAQFLDFRISSLFKFKFTRPFELNKLNKYRMLIIVNRKFEKVLHDRNDYLYDDDDDDNDDFDIYYLKCLNRYLLVYLLSRDDSCEIFLMNQGGNDESKSKRFPNYWVDKAGSSNSYIFISFFDFKNEKNFHIHMYDLNLNLLRKFSLSTKFDSKFIVGNNGLAFERKNNINHTLFFNTDDFRFTSFRKWINKSNVHFDKAYKLIHFNECFFYLFNTDINKMRIYKRNGEKFATIAFDICQNIKDYMFQFDNDYNIFFNNSNRMNCSDCVKIYSSDGKLVEIFSNKETVYLFRLNNKSGKMLAQFANYYFWQENLMNFLSTNV